MTLCINLNNNTTSWKIDKNNSCSEIPHIHWSNVKWQQHLHKTTGNESIFHLQSLFFLFSLLILKENHYPAISYTPRRQNEGNVHVLTNWISLPGIWKEEKTTTTNPWEPASIRHNKQTDPKWNLNNGKFQKLWDTIARCYINLIFEYQYRSDPAMCVILYPVSPPKNNGFQADEYERKRFSRSSENNDIEWRDHKMRQRNRNVKKYIQEEEW